MAKKGGSVHKKRLNASTITVLEKKKGYKWFVGTKPGPHNKTHSVPLISILRDLLKISETNKEARKLLRDGKVFIDQRKIKNGRTPTGLMDVISFPEIKKYYRLYFNKFGKLREKEINETNAKKKLCKVVRKTMSPKNKIQITLHDGKTIYGDNNIKVGDTVIISLPENKIIELLKFENGAKCYIMDGKHVGNYGTLKNVSKSETSKQKIAKLDCDGTEILTVEKYLFVINDNWVNEQ